MNEDKTEVLLIAANRHPDDPTSLRIGESTIHFANSARNLGVIVDSRLSMKGQVNKMCQSAYLEIRRIGSVRHFLSEEATKPLVTSLVLSRLDYCNSLLAGIPQFLIQKLQRVMNCAARLVKKVP